MACLDCKKDRKLVECAVHNPSLARICKDCCIDKMSGHRCKWFDLCWETTKFQF
ncbi:MAG: hypothetical protein HY367_01950 [Candidatus Aenigmarchaeota archaeon]|nr:hypothetical protein [Candidatus Aenigmarchaeota archaeon]